MVSPVPQPDRPLPAHLVSIPSNCSAAFDLTALSWEHRTTGMRMPILEIPADHSRQGRGGPQASRDHPPGAPGNEGLQASRASARGARRERAQAGTSTQNALPREAGARTGPGSPRADHQAARAGCDRENPARRAVEAAGCGERPSRELW